MNEQCLSRLLRQTLAFQTVQVISHYWIVFRFVLSWQQLSFGLVSLAHKISEKRGFRFCRHHFFPWPRRAYFSSANSFVCRMRYKFLASFRSAEVMMKTSCGFLEQGTRRQSSLHYPKNRLPSLREEMGVRPTANWLTTSFASFSGSSPLLFSFFSSFPPLFFSLCLSVPRNNVFLGGPSIISVLIPHQLPKEREQGNRSPRNSFLGSLLGCHNTSSSSSCVPRCACFYLWPPIPR